MDIQNLNPEDDKDPRKNALLQNVKNRMATLSGTKELFAEVMDLYAAHILSERNMKAMVYGLNNYLAYLKHESDLRFEERLDRIEEKMEDKK